MVKQSPSWQRQSWRLLHLEAPSRLRTALWGSRAEQRPKVGLHSAAAEPLHCSVQHVDVVACDHPGAIPDEHTAKISNEPGALVG